jgi:cation:H+ antiporter
LDWLVLFLSLAVVSAGAEFLVRGAVSTALRAGVSPLFVGLTVVGFGTSTPELGASLTATLRGSSDVSVGNVVGSNIFNICAILGLTALLHPIRVHLPAVRRDLMVALAAALVPWSALMLGGVLPRWLGGVFVGALAVYIAFAYRAGRRAHREGRDMAPAQVVSALPMGPPAERRRDSLVVNGLLMVTGLVLLTAGSRFFVGSAVGIARAIGVSELVIGLTVVSAGTSLPELVTSLVAARRGNPDLAVGNIIGSNIFNAFGILGVCAVVKGQAVNPQVLAVDTPVLLAATLALLPIMKSGGVISRAEGAVLLAGYAVYLATMILRGA